MLTQLLTLHQMLTQWFYEPNLCDVITDIVTSKDLNPAKIIWQRDRSHHQMVILCGQDEFSPNEHFFGVTCFFSNVQEND